MEFHSNRIFRLGTRIKTRYEPHEIFLKFNSEKKGFEKQEDPDVEKMRMIRGLISEAEEPFNQKRVRELVRAELDMTDKEIRRLLIKGLGEFWTVEKGLKNASIYCPIHPTLPLIVNGGVEVQADDKEVAD